jgi:hypothetical protein
MSEQDNTSSLSSDYGINPTEIENRLTRLEGAVSSLNWRSVFFGLTLAFVAWVPVIGNWLQNRRYNAKMKQLGGKENKKEWKPVRKEGWNTTDPVAGKDRPRHSREFNIIVE